jgi:hypothetical protein
MTGHKFKVGETVYFRSDKSGRLLGPAGAFQITKHMPVSDGDGDFQYQLKGADHERRAPERQLTTKHPPVVNASVILRDAFQSQKSVQTKKAGGKPRAKLPKELKQAIYISLGTWRRGLTSDEIKRQLYQKVTKKIEALMKHYKIPANSSDKWKDLSFCLAEELGLMTVTLDQPRGSGKPRVWSYAEAKRLVQRMGEEIQRLSKELKRKPNRVATDAAIALARKYPDEYGHLDSKTLVNRWGEAKKRLHKIPGTPLDASLKQHWLAGRRLRGSAEK